MSLVKENDSIIDIHEKKFKKESFKISVPKFKIIINYKLLLQNVNSTNLHIKCFHLKPNCSNLLQLTFQISFSLKYVDY